ncbi:MAG: ATPase [Candidatus Altiarchaeales archaeon HGW-Altiarchaeales-1]|nr:MAG: ATPase [Candidatus Altiarchaeales archaeon HGW-Altiarchaeales-1]
MITKEEIIRALYDSNFWGKEQEVGIVREEYLEKLIKIKDMKESISIAGVRRCGKSTISKQFLKHVIEKGAKKENTLYVNFEEPSFSPYLNSNILDIVYNTYSEVINPEDFAYIVLDEVQNVPNWERWVRAKQEKGKVKIIVTGSSSKLMSSEFSTVLGGRCLNIDIFPLSFREFVKFKGRTVKQYKGVVIDKNVISSLLREYLEFGGFPRAVMEKKENKNMLLKEYFDSIIFRDIVSRYNIRDVNLLKTLAIIMQTNISSPSSIGKLASVLQDSFKRKTSLETVSRFLEYFESAFLIFLVPIFSYKIKDQLQYPRKIYSIDAGLRNAVCFRFSEDIGKLYENVVFLD